MLHHPSKKKKPVYKRESREVGGCWSARTDGYLCFNKWKAMKECLWWKISIVSPSFKWNRIVKQPVSRTDTPILIVGAALEVIKISVSRYMEHKRAFLLRFDFMEICIYTSLLRIHHDPIHLEMWFSRQSGLVDLSIICCRRQTDNRRTKIMR